MEEYLVHLAENGGPIGVLAAVLVYLIIYMQRKNTSEKRNDDKQKLINGLTKLNDEINTKETEIILLKKDVDILKEENIGIKQDIKEIKNTLQTMALALERIASKYDKD